MSAERPLPAVAWRDLVALSPAERAWELTLSVPWLLGALAGWRYGAWPLALACSFFFFLTGLRQSHNAQHAALGIGRHGHDLLLAVLSALMMSSMHAVRVTHLHHHRACMEPDDHEAAHAGWPWWRALALGPVFPVRLHVTAWQLGGPRDRAWIGAELAMMAAVLDVAASGVLPTLSLHVATMLLGECFTGFFAVWIVHRGCTPGGQVARTQRGVLKNAVTYSMFYHLEHHLWPAVPTCHLPALAKRVEAASPDPTRLVVF